MVVNGETNHFLIGSELCHERHIRCLSIKKKSFFKSRKSKESKMSSGFVRSHGGKRKGRDTCSLFEEASQSPVFWNCLFFQFLSILFHFLRCCMGALLLHCVISSIWGEKTNVMVFLFYEDSCLKKNKKKNGINNRLNCSLVSMDLQFHIKNFTFLTHS